MNPADVRAMRNELIGAVHQLMRGDERIFFLSADFGAPALDPLRAEFPERFVNVGIAEQNLINMATGLALEGFVVFAYGIAPFLSMRCYEQMRINLAMMGQVRPLNVNLISVGAGISYDLSGPTHHCLEDLSVMRTLPNVALFSPSDWVQAQQFAAYAVETSGAKYARLDGKIVPPLYEEGETVAFARGFAELRAGETCCLVGTGYATHMALRVAERLKESGVSVAVVDVFMLQPLDRAGLAAVLARFGNVVTLEEGFVGCGGLDSLIAAIVREHGVAVRQHSFGCAQRYCFENDTRAGLLQRYGLDEGAIFEYVMNLRRE
ncbi:MAG: transketolase [bacterium]|nr:transketolase [bacterium]